MEASGIKREFWDDSDRDFRQRYELPVHFTWDRHDLKMIDYLGYVRIALELLPDAPQRVLDVGCGDGWVAQKTVEEGYSVVGIDYSVRAIEFAKLLVPGADFIVGDVRALSIQQSFSGCFDAALFIEVLEHIPPSDHADVLQGIRECLHEAGILVISVPSIHMPLNPWHYKHFAYHEIIYLLEQNGFKIQQVVNQHRLTLISSKMLWKVLKNRYYDLRIVRALLGRLFLSRYNTTDNPQSAGRYICQAIKA